MAQIEFLRHNFRFRFHSAHFLLITDRTYKQAVQFFLVHGCWTDFFSSLFLSIAQLLIRTPEKWDFVYFVYFSSNSRWNLSGKFFPMKMSSREFAHVSLNVLADTEKETLNAWGRNDKF